MQAKKPGLTSPEYAISPGSVEYDVPVYCNVNVAFLLSDELVPMNT
jgi:hypothetical protein